LIGAIFLLLGALRMGWVAAFIPTPVMRGFIEGLVCVTIIGQVPHLLGISGTSGNFFTKLWFLLQHLADAPLAPVLTGLLSLAAMLLLRRLAPRIPSALVVAVVATVLVGLAGGEAAGISVVGNLPPACLTSSCPALTPVSCWSSRPVHSPSSWSATPRRLAGRRRRRCRAAATSTRTRSWSRTGPPTS
jgi:Sulfate permease and related transporters (MFS superfamily)